MVLNLIEIRNIGFENLDCSTLCFDNNIKTSAYQ